MSYLWRPDCEIELGPHSLGCSINGNGIRADAYSSSGYCRVVIPRARHGGNVHAVAREEHLPVHKLIDFSASINPLGLPSGVRRALVRAIPSSIHYPDPLSTDLRLQIGAFDRIPPDSIVLGNGSAELISVLPRSLSLRHGLVIGPTFMEFERALALAGAHCTYVHAEATDQYDPPIDRVCHILSKGKGSGGKNRSNQQGSAKKN